MIPASLLTHRVSRLRPGTTSDAYGNTAPDWSAPDRLDLPARVEPRSAGEDVIDRDQLTATHVVWVRPDADIDGRDRLEFAGRVLEVLGPPRHFDTPAGPHHIELQMREVEG